MKKLTTLRSLSLIVCGGIAALAMSAPTFAQHAGGGHAGGAGHGGYGGGYHGGYGWRGGYGWYGPWAWGGLGLTYLIRTLSFIMTCSKKHIKRIP